MLTQLFAIGLADLFLVGEIGIAIRNEPSEADQVLGLSSRGFERREYVGNGLAWLLRKVGGDHSLSDGIPSNLARDGHDLAVANGCDGIAAGLRPLPGIYQLWQFAH